MAEKLILSTKESLYKPIEIEVDGVIYKAGKLTRDFLKGFFDFEKLAFEGDTDAPYKQAHYAFGIPLKVLYKLDAAEVKDINDRILTGLSSPDRVNKDTSPNSKRPGDKKSS